MFSITPPTRMCECKILVFFMHKNKESMLSACVACFYDVIKNKTDVFGFNKLCIFVLLAWLGRVARICTQVKAPQLQRIFPQVKSYTRVKKYLVKRSLQCSVPECFDIITYDLIFTNYVIRWTKYKRICKS